MDPLPKMKLTYFALWAKGPAPALALEFSGIEWSGGNDYGTGDADTTEGKIQCVI